MQQPLNSPQAKVKVERANVVLQDRLIKEMRLKNISSIEEGNLFLKEYLQDIMRNLAKTPYVLKVLTAH